MSIVTNVIASATPHSGAKLQENFLDLQRYINGGLDGVTSAGVFSYHTFFVADTSALPNNKLYIPARRSVSGVGAYIGGTGTAQVFSLYGETLSVLETVSVELPALSAGGFAWRDCTIPLATPTNIYFDLSSGAAATDVTFIVRFGGDFDPASRP